MKFFTVLAALCAIFATSHAQYYYTNVMNQAYYFSEVASMASQFISNQNSYFGSWQYIFPDWTSYLSQYTTLGQYIGQLGVDDATKADLTRHVVLYRENYTDFPLSSLLMSKQHSDWIADNFTFFIADVAVFLQEVDTACRLGTFALQQRPDCGQSDAQMFVSQTVQNISQSLSQSFSYVTASNSYLQSIIGQNAMGIFPSLFNQAIMDMYDPLYAVQQLEVNYFETNRAFLRKQLDNLTRALNWYINSGLLVSLTNQREWLINQLQSVTDFQCSGY